MPTADDMPHGSCASKVRKSLRSSSFILHSFIHSFIHPSHPIPYHSIPFHSVSVSKSVSVCALQSQGFGLCLSRRHHVPFRRRWSGGCPNGASSSCVAKLASLGTCVVRRTWSLLLLQDNREPVGPEDAVPPRGQCYVVRSVLQACHSLGPSSPRRRQDQAVGFSAAVVYMRERREALPFILRAEMSSTAHDEM